MIELKPIPAGEELPIEWICGLPKLFNRINEIGLLHLQKLPSLKELWDEDERNAEVGYSIELKCENARNPLTLHVIGEDFLVEGKVDGKLRISSGVGGSD